MSFSASTDAIDASDTLLLTLDAHLRHAFADAPGKLVTPDDVRSRSFDNATAIFGLEIARRSFDPESAAKTANNATLAFSAKTYDDLLVGVRYHDSLTTAVHAEGWPH